MLKQPAKMKNTKFKWPLLALLFPAMFLSQSAPSLKELVDSAMVNDARLMDQTLQNNLTKLNDERLKDVFLPKVEVSEKVGYMNGGVNFETPAYGIPTIPGLFPGAMIPEQSNRLNISGISPQAKAEATMLIYSGGKVKYLKEANQHKVRAEQKLMEKSKDDVISEVAKSYDQFALIHESKKALDEAKKRLDINRKTADKALGYGLITPYDHRKIELAQATLDSKLVEYEGKRELLITQLHLITGIDKDRIAQIDPKLEVLDVALIDKEIDQRAEIKALDHGIIAQDFKIKEEERWWIPKVQAATSLSYLGLFNNHVKTSEALIPGLISKLNLQPGNLQILPLFQAGVGFKWDVFDGNEGKVAIEEAKINKEILENRKKDVQKLLKLNLANNQTNYDISLAQIKLKAKAKSIANEALQNVEKEFRYGTKKSSDLIDAENDLENAELEYQTAIFNQRRHAIELLKSTQNINVNQL